MFVRYFRQPRSTPHHFIPASDFRLRVSCVPALVFLPKRPPSLPRSEGASPSESPVPFTSSRWSMERGESLDAAFLPFSAWALCPDGAAAPPDRTGNGPAAVPTAILGRSGCVL